MSWPSQFSPYNGEGIVVTDIKDGRTKACVDRVSYATPYGTSVDGKVYLTNFRVLFQATDPSGVFFEVPLGVIEKVDKYGGSSTKKDLGYGIEIATKDLRTIHFAYDPKQRQRAPMFLELLKRAFVGTNIDASVIPTATTSNSTSGDSPDVSTGAATDEPRLPELIPYCFHYKGRGRFVFERSDQPSEGWSVFSLAKEFERQGIPSDQWRISDVNRDFSVCTTYPPEWIVPAAFTDEQLRRVAEFRSKGRLPVLCWYNKENTASITRCSQPRVGFVGKRSAVDEQYVDTIRKLNSSRNEVLYIRDARPRRNAMANQAKGLGYESASAYPRCQLSFLNIHNIHVMRESLKKVRQLCWPNPPDGSFYTQLDNTGWLKHLLGIFQGSVSIVDSLLNGESVLIHCSDGWDRTSQLSAIAMLLLDPYYRTIKGFEVLIEKEWLSFGHKFDQRLGLCSKNSSDEQRSPVFLQFIDCVWQITNFFPCAFEFNENFLIFILDEMYSCLHGTFLYNSYRQRVEANLQVLTPSVWDHVSAHLDDFTNPLYDASVHTASLKYPVAMKNIQLWNNYYLRWAAPTPAQAAISKQVSHLQSVNDQLAARIAELELAVHGRVLSNDQRQPDQQKSNASNDGGSNDDEAADVDGEDTNDSSSNSSKKGEFRSNRVNGWVKGSDDEDEGENEDAGDQGTGDVEEGNDGNDATKERLVNKVVVAPASNPSDNADPDAVDTRRFTFTEGKTPPQ